MKKYFYSDIKEKHGPLSLDELKQIGICKQTLIWFEGLEDWTPAEELDEMTPILELQPPPILNEEKNELDDDWFGKVMFLRPFTYDGRIRRTEYGISLIIFVIVAVILQVGIDKFTAGIDKEPYLRLLHLPMIWFLFAQGGKRCQDLGKTSGWQFIPFYVFWLLFKDGQPGTNEYGQNPKG